ncbi:hypothetical protein CC2G_007862 [Coprinopsis cinerea AmutBmut pab1-1]|nr:hypothetical protein CC2G_007862 [Coprinopsis cinerea AmutBmut pab1-1]
MTTDASAWFDDTGRPCPPPPLPVCLREPPLWTANPYKITPKAFAIPLMYADMILFVEKHLPDDKSDDHEKQDIFLARYYEFFPPELDRLAFLIVPLKGQNGGRVLWEPIGLVVGTNLSEEDMEQARNEDLIKQAQEILGVKTCPAWYRFTDP